MNKTLYVSDQDAEVWERAEKLAGDGKVSKVVTDYLKQYVAMKESAVKGYDRIVLRLYENGIPKAYGFYGRWIISPNEPFIIRDNNGPDNLYAVAETAKNKFAFLSICDYEGEFGQSEADGYLWGRLDIAESLDKHGKIPISVIAETMKRMGIVVQELDI